MQGKGGKTVWVFVQPSSELENKVHRIYEKALEVRAGSLIIKLLKLTIVFQSRLSLSNYMSFHIKYDSFGLLRFLYSKETKMQPFHFGLIYWTDRFIAIEKYFFLVDPHVVNE